MFIAAVGVDVGDAVGITIPGVGEEVGDSVGVSIPGVGKEAGDVVGVSLDAGSEDVGEAVHVSIPKVGDGVRVSVADVVDEVGDAVLASITGVAGDKVGDAVNVSMPKVGDEVGDAAAAGEGAATPARKKMMEGGRRPNTRQHNGRMDAEGGQKESNQNAVFRARDIEYRPIRRTGRKQSSISRTTKPVRTRLSCVYEAARQRCG